jgi:TRAP-type C4-dicarboxylate transport system permease small subunit
MQPDSNAFGILNGLANTVAIACGWALLALCALTGYDIVARRLLNHSVQGVDEIGGYVLAITGSVGFAAALLNRMHTRIDLILAIMPAGLRAVMNTIAAIALAGFAVFITQKALVTLIETLEFGSRASTPLQTPLWIPQSLWIFGIVLFAIVSCVMAVHAIWLLLRGKIDMLNKQYGNPSIDEETKASLTVAGSQLNSEGLTK